jgi:hypothetical protein
VTKDLTALLILTAITTVCWIGFKAFPPQQPEDTFVRRTLEEVSPVLRTEMLEEIR